MKYTLTITTNDLLLVDAPNLSYVRVSSLIKQYAIEYPSIKITLTKETHHA